jgi:transcriptional antiterminator RfaH
VSITRISDDPRWYVIHTKPKQEERAGNNLNAWNIETLVPLFRSRPKKQNTAESKYRIGPLFPRYIFAWFNARSLLHKIRYTRGVHNVVSFGGEPTPIDDEIINSIRARVGDGGFVNISEEFKRGDKVMIDHDMFGSLEGVFKEGVGGTERVRILLSRINYQAHIEVDIDSIRLIKNSSSRVH